MQSESSGIAPWIDILQNYYWLDENHPSPVPRVSHKRARRKEREREKDGEFYLFIILNYKR